jgi:DNA-binding transcriptional regulator WhiA
MENESQLRKLNKQQMKSRKTNDYIIHLENQLNRLAEQIKKVRRENEFNGIDLNQLKEKLTILEQNLRQFVDVFIE